MQLNQSFHHIMLRFVLLSIALINQVYADDGCEPRWGENMFSKDSMVEMWKCGNLFYKLVYY